MRNIITLLLLLVLTLGCSQAVRIHQLQPGETAVEGIHYFGPAPYLLVTENSKVVTDKDGKTTQEISYQCQWVYLPDTGREYVITAEDTAVDLDLKISLKDGWMLTDFGETTTSYVAPLVESLTGTVAQLATMFALTDSPAGLYRLDLTNASHPRLVKVEVVQ